MGIGLCLLSYGCWIKGVCWVKGAGLWVLGKSGLTEMACIWVTTRVLFKVIPSMS